MSPSLQLHILDRESPALSGDHPAGILFSVYRHRKNTGMPPGIYLLFSPKTAMDRRLSLRAFAARFILSMRKSTLYGL
jgi:hypothetical protein